VIRISGIGYGLPKLLRKKLLSKNLSRYAKRRRSDISKVFKGLPFETIKESLGGIFSNGLNCFSTEANNAEKPDLVS